MSQIIIRRLARLCTGWGGKLIELTEEEFDQRDDIAGAPFSAGDLGIIWEEKVILYSTFIYPISPSDIIHEMGHVFASKEPPDSSEEYDFFGWEREVARRVGISLKAWVYSNRHYGIADNEIEYTELGLLPPRVLRKVLRERVDFAVKAGLIQNGRPVAIR